MTLCNSINLSTVPFISSCDSTRLQMSSKQVQQSLTHPNCEIPFAISHQYRNISDSSKLGLMIAKSDGKVIFKEENFITVIYNKTNELVTYYIPKIHKTNSDFCNTRTFCLNRSDSFKEGDIIYSYDCFKNGIPSYGYNVNSAFMCLCNLNHEDGIIISESFAKKAQATFSETVIIPINEYTLLSSLYDDVEDSFTYFPNIGQKIKGDVVVELYDYNIGETAQNKLLISDLLTLNHKNLNKLNITPIKTKVHNGYVSDIKIHYLNPGKKLQETNLNIMLAKCYNDYIIRYNLDGIKEEMDQSNPAVKDFLKELVLKYLVFTKNNKSAINNRAGLFAEAIYVIEMQITKESGCVLGDKLATRHANKGVISHILPDEFRPISMTSGTPIDILFSPFAVFSRMNISQLLESLVAKNVKLCDDIIKCEPERTIQTLEWLNEYIIKPLNDDDDYYNHVKEHINKLKTDEDFYNKFIYEVQTTNLFIETPSFTEIDIKKLLEHSIPVQEDVLIKKETIEYLKNKLNIDIGYNIEDVIIPDVFVGPMYVSRLYKVVNHLINARDIGQVKSITKQPTKGKARGGGSQLGQMEMECLMAHGLDRVLKEFTITKSDSDAPKKDLIKQTVTTGKYNMNLNEIDNSSCTKTVINQYIEAIKD